MTTYNHAATMTAYAIEAQYSDTPWANWQYRPRNCTKFKALETHPRWFATTEYRRNPELDLPVPTAADDIVALISEKPRLCRVWDSTDKVRVRIVTSYNSDSDKPFVVDNGSVWANASLLSDDEIKSYLSV